MDPPSPRGLGRGKRDGLGRWTKSGLGWIGVHGSFEARAATCRKTATRTNCRQPETLLPVHGGYRHLKSFQIAQLAFDVYVHRLCSEIGSMLASLGGLDALVFTAGVGENSPQVRASVGKTFAFLGMRLDEAKNAQSPPDTDIATPDSAVRVLVVHTQEEWEIAQECYRVTNK